MLNWWLIGGVALIFLGWTWYRGNKTIKFRESLIRENTKLENIDDKDIYYLSYHGGIPSIPKPQKLYVAIANQYILFFNDEGNSVKICSESFRMIDNVVTKKKPNLKGKSIILWGPFIGFFLTVKLRYYIIVEYIDSNNHDNNILLECESQSHKQLYNRICGFYNKSKNQLNTPTGACS